MFRTNRPVFSSMQTADIKVLNVLTDVDKIGGVEIVNVDDYLYFHAVTMELMQLALSKLLPLHDDPEITEMDLCDTYRVHDDDDEGWLPMPRTVAAATQAKLLGKLLLVRVITQHKLILFEPDADREYHISYVTCIPHPKCLIVGDRFMHDHDDGKVMHYKIIDGLR